MPKTSIAPLWSLKLLHNSPHFIVENFFFIAKLSAAKLFPMNFPLYISPTTLPALGCKVVGPAMNATQKKTIANKFRWLILWPHQRPSHCPDLPLGFRSIAPGGSVPIQCPGGNDEWPRHVKFEELSRAGLGRGRESQSGQPQWCTNWELHWGIKLRER